MKLVHPLIENPIELKDDKVNVLVVENREVYTKLITDLFVQINDQEGNYILSEKGEIISISKCCELIFNPFQLDFSKRKLITQVQNELKELAYEGENFIETVEFASSLNHYIENLFEKMDYPLIYNNEWDIVSIFKAIDMKIDDYNGSLVERVLYYIKLVKDILGVKCFAFINLGLFLTDNEIKGLIDNIVYEKVSVLMIESREIGGFHNSSTYVIDNDLCEIWY